MNAAKGYYTRIVKELKTIFVQGRQLSFIDDDVATPGLGWVASGGL